MRVMGVLACIFVMITIKHMGIVQGLEGNRIPFSLKNATSITYAKFIDELRAQLIKGSTQLSYGIPVLPRRSVAVVSPNCFILVDLVRSNDRTITVAIDAVNVDIVAYRVGYSSYFLRQDDPTVPITALFLGTIRQTLQFSATYADLEKAAGTSRERIPLGLLPLENALDKLWHSESVAESLLVVVQMVSEAAKFKFIETQLRRTMVQGQKITPGSAILSLENKWSDLSTEIQQAFQGGIFGQTVEVRSTSNDLILVDSVASPIVAGMVLLLYRCTPLPTTTTSNGGSSAFATNQILIRTHVEDDICTMKNRTTRISGWNGLCVDVRDGHDKDGTPVQLWPCGQQRNQKWTFQTDGSIRSMGKCMTTSGYRLGNYVMIYSCDKIAFKATKWTLSTDGTITNSLSGLVLTSSDSKVAEGKELTVKTNTHNARQSWRAGDDVKPIVSYIVGYNDMCLQANNENTQVWLENCVLGKEKQRWALYGDGTIRVNSDRSLCLTSNGHSSMNVIIILKCQGQGDQRWVFMTNGSILNPNAQLVMTIKDNNVSLHQIILYTPMGLPNQQWLPSY